MSDASLIALITSIAAFCTAALGSLTQIWLSSRAAARAEKKLDENTQRLDGRLSELVKSKTGEALATGELKGRDAADTAHAERVLAHEEAQVVGIIVAGRDGKIVDWNTAATTMFLWQRDEAIGKDVKLLTPIEYRGKHARGFFLAATDRKEFTRGPINLSGLDKNGREFPIAIFLSGWKDNGGWFCAAKIYKRKAAPDIPITEPVSTAKEPEQP